jgi:hypothetical protein
MTVEETVIRLITRYPTLFQHRWQCLDQLFCVLGSGFEWCNGERAEIMSMLPWTNHEQWDITLVARLIEACRKEPMRFYGDGAYLVELPANAEPVWIDAWYETKDLIEQAKANRESWEI